MTNEEKKSLVKKIQSQLRSLDLEMERLKARKDVVRADMKAEFEKRMAAMRKGRQEAQERLDRLQEAGEGAWHDLKAGLEKTVDDLKESYSRAKKHFKEE